jgi:hypothetical protein
MGLGSLVDMQITLVGDVVEPREPPESVSRIQSHPLHIIVST